MRRLRLEARKVTEAIIGGKSDAPPAPDYLGAAQAQGAANLQSGQQTASLSNPNIFGPYGNQTVSYAPTGPDGMQQPTIQQSLSPAQQQLLDSQNALKTGLANLGQSSLGTVQGVMGTPFDGSKYGLQTSAPGLDLSGVAKMPVNAGTTGYNAIMSRLEPQMGRQQVSAETALTNQGLRPGTEAWTNAMTDLHNSQNDQRTQAAAQGVGLDMSANNQGYNQALQAGQYAMQNAQFGNTAQQQAYQQALSNYNLPLNQITALMSGSQVTNPQFQSYSGTPIASGNIAGAANQAGQYAGNIFSNQVGQQNAMTSGLAALGSSGLMYAALA